ncbi:uncharacterized protein LOC127855936 [Dreissena polymorpha]|uniref:Autophagy-related protein 27 n=1 Tax=Dreissena polymorpha TaxID=45954 RepID=A0A9D4HGT0_DREPO|nr:uncharacterized protein LOC127855936 [Dreissena polymorpha]KAH3716853.1 hypothetical protein DPMN_059584 [Dreissena polymorpha]
MGLKTNALIFVLFAISIAEIRGQVGQCTTLTPCACVYDDGVIVNLTSLSRNDGFPNFSNKTDNHGDVYSWNPCTPFSYVGPKNNTECTNVSVCMVRHGFPSDLYFNLGTEDSAQFSVDVNGTLKLTYTKTEDGFQRSAEISLQCLDSSVFDFLVIQGEQDINNDTIVYKMTLASKWACAYAPKIDPALPSAGLGGGAIFAIVLFSLIGGYLLLGVAYQAFVKKESGARLCPNHEFWFSIPGYFKSGKKPLSETKGGAYESI